MFSLSIVVGNTSLAFMYSNADRAAAAYELATQAAFGPSITIEDDFGQKLNANRDSIHAVVLEDLGKTKLAHIERMLINARIQVDAQKRAQTDDALKYASRPQGPAIQSPFNGGIIR